MENGTIEHFKKLFIDIKKQKILEDLELDQTFDFKEDGSGDDADQAQSARERQLLLKLKGRQNFFLKKVDQALDRIENGTFGHCEECDCEIEESRLMARPTATLCISCKEEQEREEGKIPYQKRSKTNGRSIVNETVVNLRADGEEVQNEKVLKFNRDRIIEGLKH